MNGNTGDTEGKTFLNRKEASRYLATIGVQISPKTLANLGCNSNARKGPPYYRPRWRSVQYDKAELKKWAEAQMVRVE